MKNFFKKFTPPLEITIITFGVILSIIFGIFYLNLAKERLSEFVSYHTLISKNSTKNISYDIEQILQHKKQLVQSFLEDNVKLVNSVIAEPDNDALYDKLNTKLSRYFTDYISSNIVTSSGELIVDDFDGKIGQLCINDMKTFIKTGKQITRIHPNATIYHFDIRARFKENSENIFIVTFNASTISNLLNAASPNQHDIVIFNNIFNIIEITKIGSRKKLKDRLDYRLSNEEKNRKLTSHIITDSYWDVLDLHNPSLFSDYKEQLIKQGSLVYGFFISLILVMSLVLFIGTRKKHKLEKFLLDKNGNIDKLNKKLETISQTDSLTGLYNRRYLESRGQVEFSTASRLGLILNIALIDVDFFKNYNDTYGHQQGDDCLISIAEIILRYFRRSNEFVARYGGEEFIVVNLGDEKFVTRLTALLKSMKINNIKHESSAICDYVTISIGMTSMFERQCNSMDDLINEADIALYNAKSSGRDQLVRSKFSDD
ncbi:hypothetical protein MNBD_GAMMA22-1136 [hydrothermal vent metagenome]|uniref:GGDEF domain-containing protein n=1 Tax=hydrothermal vent metagenome TaxID=652676 RepID=A0A3B1A7Q6_9ZZZZ